MISRRVWFIISIGVAVYAIGLVFDLTPYLRGPDEWRWARFPVLRWEGVWPVLIVLAAIAGWVIWVDRRLERSTRPQRLMVVGVGMLMLAALALQLLALRTERLNPFEALFDRSVDVAANGYFTVAQRITDPVDFLRRYPELMPTFPIHPQVHPPGIPLIYWFTGSALESAPSIARTIGGLFRQMECNAIDFMLLSDARLASGLAGMLLPLVANVLTVWCVYRLALARFGRRAGLFAAALWTVVPSAVLFSGSWSQVYPFLACAAWLMVDAGLTRRRVWPFLVAGLILSAATFLELGTAVLGVFLTLYILAHHLIARRNLLRDWRFLLAASVAALAGVSAVWIGCQAVSGVSLSQIVNAMLPIHLGYKFNQPIWMIYHPYDYMIFLGLPLAWLLIVVSIRALKAVRSERVDALSASFGVGLLAVSLLDPVRDETARTWILLMPFAVVIVSSVLAGPAARPRRFALVWGLIGIQLLAMIATLRVVETGLYGQPPRSTLAAIPAETSEVQADFNGMVRLVGYHVDGPAAGRLKLDLYWRATAPVDHPYVVFNHLTDDQGQIVSQHDGRPQEGQPLMTCWQPGELYPDRHVIDLGADVPAGSYTLKIGLYNGVTGARVPVIDAQGAADQVVLRRIEVTRVP